ncbi:MAG: hypothetical protein LC112_13960 [Flavobacteriales bacterium]|nr:hypothetical protein [Flavobacteriales bacterium]
MLLTINGTLHNVPSDISEVTVGKFAEYYDKYGRALDEELVAIFENQTDQDLLELDLQQHIDKEALSWYTFFTGYNFFESKDIELTDVLIQYRILRTLLKESETKSRDFPHDADWMDAKWRIQDFRVQPGSTMTFNEVITSKEVVRQITKLGKGKWDALIYLCCIFFRKVDEPFADELTSGERFKLIEQLPLNYAMSVAFFLNSSIRIFRQHLVSSTKVEMTTM